MVSPVYSSSLYADESKVKGVSNINTSAVDLEKYPEVMKMEYWVAEADEGDCMYIPQMWWHQVHSRYGLLSSFWEFVLNVIFINIIIKIRVLAKILRN